MMTVNSEVEQEKFDEDELPGRLSHFFHLFRDRFGWGAAIVLVAAVFITLSAIRTETAQGSAQPSPAVDVVARPCKSIPAGSKRSKRENKNRSRKPGDEDGNTTSACIEVHSTAIEVQEYLQAQAREEKWNLTDEHVAEDAWTFSRKMERDELLRYTKNDASTERVNWTSGIAFIQVKTEELHDGFVRVQASARFQGYGQSSDRFAPPKESWPLSSNTSLENQLISILDKHFRNAQ